MPWETMSVDELAGKLGVDVAEVREKQRLIRKIVEARKGQKYSQAALAKKVGVSQGRIAQIESGIGTARVSFDVLLKVLSVLGLDYKITLKHKAA
ncbi:MAG: helix-turn-helix domain-containing protein [Nitrospinae bacterium]|nr:helix-turn-helix domain-containing protein [Nitrospinota bacterium]